MVGAKRRQTTTSDASASERRAPTHARRHTVLLSALPNFAAATALAAVLHTATGSVPAEVDPEPAPPPDGDETEARQSGVTPLIPGMARFPGAVVYPGKYSAEALQSLPSEYASCIHSRRHCFSSSPAPVSLRSFHIDTHEVTTADFAHWLDRIDRQWRDNKLVETSTAPHRLLAYIGKECGTSSRNNRIRILQGWENRPAACMTWYAASLYCAAHPIGKRLPSEAEWEHVAKGPSGNLFPWGNTAPLPGKVSFGGDSVSNAARSSIGTSDQDVSPHGVHDLAGGISEWVTTAPEEGALRRIRGGNWNSSACSLLTSVCTTTSEETIGEDVGFRCAINE